MAILTADQYVPYRHQHIPCNTNLYTLNFLFP